MKQKKLMLGIAGVILLAWVLLPDPLPIAIDDIIAALAGSVSLLQFFQASQNKEMQNAESM